MVVLLFISEADIFEVMLSLAIFFKVHINCSCLIFLSDNITGLIKISLSVAVCSLNGKRINTNTMTAPLWMQLNTEKWVKVMHFKSVQGHIVTWTNLASWLRHSKSEEIYSHWSRGSTNINRIVQKQSDVWYELLLPWCPVKAYSSSGIHYAEFHCKQH